MKSFRILPSLELCISSIIAECMYLCILFSDVILFIVMYTVYHHVFW